MTTRDKLIDLLTHDIPSGDHRGTLAFSARVAEFIADHLIANGVTVQEWHPASEPPKAEENPVLCNFYGAVNPAWYHSSTQEWETYGGAIITPKCWMKMPTTPKGDEP